MMKTGLFIWIKLFGVKPKPILNTSLTNLKPMFHYYAPRKRNIRKFLGGIEIEQWPEIG